MRWDQLAWNKRQERRSMTSVPCDQFQNRKDRTVLREQEEAGNYVLLLLQINQYSQRKKVFRIEVWSKEEGASSGVPHATYEEEWSQVEAEQRFSDLVISYSA
ncbi:hypothetical protein ACFSWD_17515 [Paenibacillus xanthanilyticus]